MINEDTLIMEIITKIPGSVDVFAQYGMKCLG
ncbi:MAG: DUF1858 domain-containing protein [Thermincola sp.]|jgi:hypothetical protein|nr:DUF1858 domain-containing protein [Thermincola sp.]MDT3701448.1 DUF1858 domain-containing protein [Thermincola sp.]